MKNIPRLRITKDIIILILLEDTPLRQGTSTIDGSKTYEIIFSDGTRIYLKILVKLKTRINLFFHSEQWNFLDWNLDSENKILKVRSHRIM